MANQRVEGGPEGLSDLYARWSPLVYSLALRSLDDVTAAEEVTKQVFTRLWDARGTVDPADDHFSTWLVDLTCTRIAAVETAAGREAPSTAGRLLLADELAHLDAVPQRVLRLVLDDVGLPEVAERTGLSVADVRRQVADSLAELRRRWEVQPDAL